MIVDFLASYGLSVEYVLIAMSALSAGTISLTVWLTLLHRDPGARRVQAIVEQREALRAGMIAPRRRRESLPTLSVMRRVVDRFNLLRSDQASKIAAKLMRAGWRSKDAIVRYLFAKIALPFAFGGIAVLIVYGFDIFALAPHFKIAVTAGSVLIGAYAADIFVNNAGQKRKEKVRDALPDALDLMVICAEAGLSLDATLMRVSKEMERSTPQISDELSLTGLELGFLPDRRTALLNLTLRNDLPGVRGMVNTLMQAERFGTPLARSLRIMAAESRDERVMRAEEKAARLPALLTVPMICFILPPLFIILLGQAILNVIDTFKNIF